MALLFIDSFDHYQSANILSKWTSNWLASVIGVGRGRCSTNGLVLTGVTKLIKGLPFGSTTGTVGHAVYYDSALTVAPATVQTVALGDDEYDHLEVSRLPDGALRVRRVDEGSVLGTTAPDLVHMDHWYFLEFQATIHATTGAFSLRLNNTEVLAASGLNTVGGLATPQLRRILFSSLGSEGRVIDDLYVLDSTGSAPLNTFLGDCRVEYLRPNGGGSLQQWTPVGIGTHWEAVDDVATPDDDTTYVEATTAGLTDTNHYQNTGLPSGPLFGAQLSLYAKKSETGPRVIAPVAVGVTGASHVTVSAGTYQYHHTPYGTNPATGLAWTIADINAAQFGVTVVS